MKKFLILSAIMLGLAGLAPNIAFASGGSGAVSSGSAGSASSSSGGSSAAAQAKVGVDSTGATSKADVNGIVKVVVNTMLFIIGALSVIMIIWSGLQYIISAGDSGKVSKAKNTLLYSIVGLIVALLAAAIVNFVLEKLG